MKNSYDSQDLINEVLDDITTFGEDFNVYAIYSYFEQVDKRWIDEEFITDYVHADEPARKDILDGLWDEEDEREFQQLLADYKSGMKSLEQTKHKKMTLQELLQKLEEQDRIFQSRPTALFYCLQ